MKKSIITSVLFVILSFCLTAQSKYVSGMNKAFSLIGEKKINESVALFERISQAETDKWLPSFHGAHTLIWNSFGVKEKSELESLLEQAKLLIAESHRRSNNNAEIYSLEAMLYTSYMAYDPATYGMMYAAKIEGLHNKAFDLEPTNPRVLAGKIRYDHGKSMFFGQDPAPYCDKMKKIIPIFNENRSEEMFAPSYGLEQAKMFIQSCNE